MRQTMLQTYKVLEIIKNETVGFVW